MSKVNLLNYSSDTLAALMETWGQPRYRAKQLIQWIHQKDVIDFEQMTNLSKAFRAILETQAEVVLPEVAYDKVSADGTRKWLFRFPDQNAVETVYIPETDRATLCVSSQVGCAVNCTFCSTGKQGFNRDLSLAEIIGQLFMANRLLRASGSQLVTNVVMMGMGEPLLNFENVVSALELMLDDCAYGLSKRRVTLSTSGFIPQMLALKARVPVALAVSLHAPNDALRNTIVPINRKYPLKELMAVCRDYFADEPRRSVMMEYVMLEGVNDSLAQANELIRLLQGMAVKINLIPFNPFPLAPYQCSKPEQIRRFQEKLIAAGFITTIRKTRGDDIDGACGQLVGKVQKRMKKAL